MTALSRPGVDGLLATADIAEDLLLLGALEGKLVFSSMNRGGLQGSAFEMDDRNTGYDVRGHDRAGFDGGEDADPDRPGRPGDRRHPGDAAPGRSPSSTGPA